MKQPIEGQAFPDFTLDSADGQVSLHQYKGRKVLIYFYPKDMTPTCTNQACLMRDHYEELKQMNVEVLGISPDNAKSHDKFAQKYELPFKLLIDEDHKLAEQLGVWRLKKLYGVSYMGIVRTTFLIDEKGMLIKKWDNVRLKGHLEQIMNILHS